ncbi:MAG: hypothetical protein WC663_03330 [Patescibacteria group bacterium]|jgi:hypothetical protein
MLSADDVLLIFFFHILEPISENSDVCLMKERRNDVPFESKTQRKFRPTRMRPRDKMEYFLKIRG